MQERERDPDLQWSVGEVLPMWQASAPSDGGHKKQIRSCSGHQILKRSFLGGGATIIGESCV